MSGGKSVSYSALKLNNMLKNNKKYLYWLIDQYLSNKINAREFCDDYHTYYDLEINSNTLDDNEKKIFWDNLMLNEKLAVWDHLYDGDCAKLKSPILEKKMI